MDDAAYEALHDRNQLYRENSQGMIENVYLFKILNKSQERQHFSVSLEADHGIHLSRPVALDVDPGEQASFPLTLVADPEKLEHHKRNYEVEFDVRSESSPRIHKSIESRFLAPGED